LRGPGEIYGTMQSGILDLRVADIYDHKLISEVKQAAETFINKHNLLEYAQLAEKINRLKSITTLD
jgi:RecG-like helicase